MTLIHKIAFFLFTLVVTQIPSQINYLAVDHASFVLKQKPAAGSFSKVPQGKMLRFSGTYIGESFQLGFGGLNSLGLGLGLTRIDYEKQWLGTFPENNQFGAATLKGKIQYLSLPLSLTFIAGAGIRGCYAPRRSAFRSGITITYVPSFQTRKSFAVSTYGAADSSSFFSGYDPAPRDFQHAITLGLCSQLFFSGNVALNIEPYLGYGSGYFYVKGNSGTFTYGIKFQLRIHLRLPRISIERQGNQVNTEEKKRLLRQKQKEIEDQLNKQP